MLYRKRFTDVLVMQIPTTEQVTGTSSLRQIRIPLISSELLQPGGIPSR